MLIKRKEKKAKEGQEEVRITCTHKPAITRSVPKFSNKNELDLAHKMYINRVSSARKQKEEIYKKLNPNYSKFELIEVYYMIRMKGEITTSHVKY